MACDRFTSFVIRSDRKIALKLPVTIFVCSFFIVVMHVSYSANCALSGDLCCIRFEISATSYNCPSLPSKMIYQDNFIKNKNNK